MLLDMPMSADDRYQLQELLSRTATRQELIANYRIPDWFVYRGNYMPEPVAIIGPNYSLKPQYLYDVSEVIIKFRQRNKQHRTWTYKEVKKLMGIKQANPDVNWTTLCTHFPDRSIDSIRGKYVYESRRSKVCTHTGCDHPQIQRQGYHCVFDRCDNGLLHCPTHPERKS